MDGPDSRGADHDAPEVEVQLHVAHHDVHHGVGVVDRVQHVEVGVERQAVTAAAARAA